MKETVPSFWIFQLSISCNNKTPNNENKSFFYNKGFVDSAIFTFTYGFYMCVLIFKGESFDLALYENSYKNTTVKNKILRYYY
jgi:hypothetical protein